ncbi:MAG: hypothetical protein RJR37_00595 [Peptococcaceae bacterium MAG4]|nr:hypothetical protein [Peptococcaceae bacterium MAG4]
MLVVKIIAVISVYCIVGCLLNCAFYYASRLAGAWHVADKRAAAAAWWMLASIGWLLIFVFSRLNCKLFHNN